MLIVAEKVLDEMVAAIVQKIDPEQSYLFDSHACGEAHPDFNIDLLIVEQAPCGPCRRIGIIKHFSLRANLEFP
jgi:hypothetical protein